MPFWICKKLCKILNNLMCTNKILKMCKFPLTGCLQILSQNFFAELVQSVSLCHRLSKKLQVIKIWQLKVGQNRDLVCYRKSSHSGSVPEDSASQYKSPVLCRDRGLSVFRKSQKISTASDQYLLSKCKKKLPSNPFPPTKSRNIWSRLVAEGSGTGLDTSDLSWIRENVSKVRHLTTLLKQGGIFSWKIFFSLK